MRHRGNFPLLTKNILMGDPFAGNHVRSRRQYQYSGNAWNLCKCAEGIAKVSKRFRSKMQNHAKPICIPDYQLFSVP